MRKVLAEIQLKLVTIDWRATSIKKNCLNFPSENFEKSYFHGYLQTTTYKTQTQPLSLQLANLQKSKSLMNIFEGFCLLSWNAFNLHWTIIFELKSRFFPLQIYPSQNVNKIRKLTIDELNLWSYVQFEQVNGWQELFKRVVSFDFCV